MTENKLFEKTVESLAKLIVKADAEKDFDKKYKTYTKLQLAVADAYAKLPIDFISAVIRKLEQQGMEYPHLMRWTFFFECLSLYGFKRLWAAVR